MQLLIRIPDILTNRHCNGFPQMSKMHLDLSCGEVAVFIEDIISGEQPFMENLNDFTSGT